LEKGDAIARITQLIRENSTCGGFVRKDEGTGRWYRIRESEARDKVGHAIRKAVQRLEDTKPKLASRLRKKFSSLTSRVARDSISLPSNVEGDDDEGKKSAANNTLLPPAITVVTGNSGKDNFEEGSSPRLPSVTDSLSISSGLEISQSNEVDTTPGSISANGNIANPIAARSALQEDAAYRTAASATVFPRASSDLPGLAERSSARATGLSSQEKLLSSLLSQQGTISTLPGNHSAILSQILSRKNNSSFSNQPSYLLQPHDQFLALRLQEQKSQDQLALIRALQQQEEARLRREIEYHSQRVIPTLNSPLGAISKILPWAFATPGNNGTLSSNGSNNYPVGRPQPSSLPTYPTIGFGGASQRSASLDVIAELLKLQQSHDPNKDEKKK
jgi:hypothetical protein